MVGNACDEVDERGQPVSGDSLLILLNAHFEEVPFVLPPAAPDQAWVRVIDTIDAQAKECRFAGDTTYPLQGRTLALFRLDSERRRRPEADRD
jgi:glycogen operon protein